MKKFALILAFLMTFTIITNAQIPNHGFELWTTSGSYSDPDSGWVTNNQFSAGTYYPVTKSADHYPASVGSFSIKMENNSLLSGTAAEKYGYTATAKYPGYNGPFFRITGHPNSLCGYYKFESFNNDTMTITAVLYQNGVVVSTAVFTDTSTTSTWTSFNIPFSTYTVADSAQIGFSAFHSSLDGTFPTGPYGNSILYIDNISFDNLITGVPDHISDNTTLMLFPNPATDIITINVNGSSKTDLNVNIYNITGSLVKAETLEQNQQQINISNLSNGIYLVEINSENICKTQKLIIQK